MTATEVQDLINDIPCDLCNAPPGLAWYLVLAAMVDLANGDPVPETTQELISEANCLLCLVSPGMVPYLMIAALREISSGGGAGGGSGVTCGIGDPVAAPIGTCGVYIDNTNPAAPEVWVWNGVAWVAVIV